MAPKTITISEDAYEILAAHKRRDESFSDVIRRLAGVRSDPLDAAGAYPGLGTAVEDAQAEFELDR